ncbi:Eco57I restriction-modification methylase domain-containing protein [Schaalia sp. lx-260]|uniref:Eco57I restriction-modification methylase domain-containing protein n=1 Tax=Schaalia sp. lx-260 TaxID=2899082 RepID=UPI001E36778A|nr:Eco57I restriction-modification methylase domain-containing protein [Schaalia sp. lx-260]MCD4549185.1 Eco57I restriction-modification methylase domain-containing protein [Schaalia sp. lx-260]
MSVSNLLLNKHNPDVLTCIANLSNDEVFTPPEMAAAMLDLVTEAWARDHDGENLWANPNVRVLDPFVKTGVFLREATRRFNEGLITVIPDAQERVNHILTKQIYGIAITELTALMSRRSVYCSKYANSEHSICTAFDTPDGNIWFERTEHTWDDKTGTRESRVDPLSSEEIFIRTGRRCSYCGAGENDYGRGEDLETHAYAFIHTNNIRQRINEIFGADMHFDLVIGNPPYQLNANGGNRDIPIYQYFVQQAKQLDSRYLAMIIPSRWMSTGLGLSEFRKEMLSDKNIRALVDYPSSAEVFPGVEVRGGVSYFLRTSTPNDSCSVTTVTAGLVDGPHERDLSEFDVFVRHYKALSILRKVLTASEESIQNILSVDKEFGWTSNFKGLSKTRTHTSVPVYCIQERMRQIKYIDRAEVCKSEHLLSYWKVLIPEAASDGGQRLPDIVLGKPWIAPSGSACTQSFLFFYVDTEAEARSIESYYRTRFFRFLVSLRKTTQHAPRATYTWVPMQTWDHEWTDEELYAKYGITDEEIAFIESIVRPMEDE